MFVFTFLKIDDHHHNNDNNNNRITIITTIYYIATQINHDKSLNYSITIFQKNTGNK